MKLCIVLSNPCKEIWPFVCRKHSGLWFVKIKIDNYEFQICNNLQIKWLINLLELFVLDHPLYFILLCIQTDWLNNVIIYCKNITTNNMCNSQWILYDLSSINFTKCFWKNPPTCPNFATLYLWIGENKINES